ncbi:Uu.00g071270.m01.CDS01 [Anthostomella pinea]|uniref:Uu.00g071270.m01.CDS01 n=1 Tax=Anthostomella pinea TaxID=933095 RepID=A0AAI8VUU0_9PEZI|nr:Uu.00g071270.m01.CDS01 [Anthostomella pinea]
MPLQVLPLEAQTLTAYAFALQKRHLLRDPTVRFLRVVDQDRTDGNSELDLDLTYSISFRRIDLY